MTLIDDRPAQTAPPRINDRNWRNFAACRNASEPDLWFPIGNTGSAAQQITELKQFCNALCPAIDFCLQWALQTNQEAGVWGGMSEDERRLLKRRVVRQRARMGGSS